MKGKKRILGLLLLIIGVIGGGLIWFRQSARTSQSETTIRIGSKDFTENLVVAEIYALALEDADYKVERVANISSSLIHETILNDEIDLYPEYTGTGLLTILGEELETDPEKVYETVKRQYEEQFQLTWLDYAEANDSAGLAIRKETADKYNIKTISDLQKNAGNIRMASQGEYEEREDGLPALEKVYGKFNWQSSKVYDNSLKYQVLENNEADVTPAYTTEGQLAETDKFLILEDDKHVWPPYNLAPVVRDTILEANPEIKTILNKLSARLDTETVTKLNAQVDVEGKEYVDVAKDFYSSIK
ncbi:glycine betaine ABC transporter substrate-binding protein [Streptococcus sp. H49]|uniref:glycine betaine ABC transporter substrate-binding protein n=1 Tax=Streptococcus huangxiaojuni TaxID=3237239 RepID=UPI0034A22C07